MGKTHTLVLTNKQGIDLYNFMQNVQLDRVKNRARWKFLKVIEDDVFTYEKWVTAEQTKLNEEKDNAKKLSLLAGLNKELEAKAKESHEYIFKDREVYSEAKTVFELAGKDLQGQASKSYVEIETAFMDAKEQDITN